MPKMKSNRGAAKRFTLTGTGKVRRAKQNRRHILTKKSPGRKRRLRKTAYLTPADASRITRLIKV
ncbi:MAG: 50S ribosomal protein L35 [Candidatus Sumerlaeia bacterium]|nr:50S ribosomal protein L35 [Candidatus Sumerlaeia bacterium]